MTCIVQKYGGSSLAEVDKLRKIAALIADIKSRNIDIAVVVSAMGKTTDELVAMAREISPKPPRREMDMLLSTGERITMALLCMALHERGLDALSLTGSQAGPEREVRGPEVGGQDVDVAVTVAVSQLQRARGIERAVRAMEALEQVEVAQHGLQKRQVYLERVLRCMGHLAHDDLRQVGQGLHRL